MANNTPISFTFTFNVLESIPAFYCVTGDPAQPAALRLASSTDLTKLAIGIVTSPIAIGTASVQVFTDGVVTNPQWSWDVTQGKELFCGPTGELTQSNEVTINEL